MSAKPRVAMTAVRAPLRSMTALMTSVVPWMTCSVAVTKPGWRASSLPTPSSTASEGSAGVVSTFSTVNAPVASSRRTKSVNVPPMSQPSRQDVMALVGGGGERRDPTPAIPAA